MRKDPHTTVHGGPTKFSPVRPTPQGMEPESWTESQPGDDFLTVAHLLGGGRGRGAYGLGRHHLPSHPESVSACQVQLGGDDPIEGNAATATLIGGETLKKCSEPALGSWTDTKAFAVGSSTCSKPRRVNGAIGEGKAEGCVCEQVKSFSLGGSF